MSDSSRNLTVPGGAVQHQEEDESADDDDDDDGDDNSTSHSPSMVKRVHQYMSNSHVRLFMCFFQGGKDVGR